MLQEALRQQKCESIDTTSQAFLEQCKDGPSYVCCCCHRLMYRKTVITYNSSKYTKAPANIVQVLSVHDSGYHKTDGNDWICRTCDSTLKRGNLPVQSVVNNLGLQQIPEELAELNALERRLICK